MVEQKKKMRLDELQVESFVTTSPLNTQTVQGGEFTGNWVCWTITVSLEICSTIKDFSKGKIDCGSAGGETYCCS